MSTKGMLVAQALEQDLKEPKLKKMKLFPKKCKPPNQVPGQNKSSKKMRKRNNQKVPSILNKTNHYSAKTTAN